MLTNRPILRCPWCGKSSLWQNNDGLYYCTEPSCGFRSYTLSSSPQPQREPQLTGELTSSQTYVEKLKKVFGYESAMQIWRLRLRLGNIQIDNASEGISIVYFPAGGEQRLPAPPGATNLQFIDPCPEIRQLNLNHKLEHPYSITDIPGQCSGKPVKIHYGFKS